MIGACAAAASLGIIFWTGPLHDCSLTTALLMAGAGAGILVAAWEVRRARSLLRQAEHETHQARAQRDAALVQTRRMRAQADGLALMREIHRSTGIPERHERLHRILTLLADLFEAREVSLFAVVTGAKGGYQALPAACLRVTSKEELFIEFDTDEFARAVSIGGKRSRLSPEIAKNSANITREGSHLNIEGILKYADIPVAKALWRRGAGAEHDALLSRDPSDILNSALAKVDCGPEACAFAEEALERRRTVSMNRRSAPGQAGLQRSGAAGIISCVPLLADQRAVGVLRIRRSSEGFDGPEAEALEELLLESAKHIALAMKKDEDDRKAITDSLTSLYIKRHFLFMLEQFRTAALTQGASFCLVLCDIDHFKAVNDTHGHLSGDRVLKGVAAVIRNNLHKGYMAFRYGGEELAVLLPSTGLEDAAQVAESLRKAVAAAAFRGEKNQIIPVTISLGVAEYQPELSSENLIGRVDRALYESKRNGRNRSTCWSQD